MGIKLRYWVRLAKAFSIRFRGVLFAGIIVGLLVFSAARYFAPYLAAETELIGMTGRYHIEDLPQKLLSDIGEGLTTLNEDGTVSPGLAKTWESSEDGRVWTFHIDTEKRWHDGTQVKSSDIQYVFEDAQIERPDEQTLTFRLSAPFSPFPVVASRPVFKRGLVGTGEWTVSKITSQGEFIDKLILMDAQGERKILQFFPSEDATKLAFQLGKVDILADLLDVTPFDKWNTVEISEQVNRNRFVAIFFNNSSEVFVNNKPLRQALSYGIDKDNLGFERAIGPISPNSWAYNPQIKDYAYDVPRAKALLGKGELKFTLTTSPFLLKTAEKIAEQWKALGANVDVQVVSILPQDYQAFMAIYNIPSDPDQYSIWHSTQAATNISKLNNPRIDKLLEDGRLELNQTEREKIYLDFQRFLLEEAPAVFLYHPVSYTVRRK